MDTDIHVTLRRRPPWPAFRYSRSKMCAAWYEHQGPAREVLKISEMADPTQEAARAINEALLAGWNGMRVAERFRLDEIATAHERVEAPRHRGRVVVLLS